MLPAMIQFSNSRGWENVLPLQPVPSFNRTAAQYCGGLRATTPSLDFSEACEHGFADCVFVRVGGCEVVVAAFGSEAGSLCSQLSLGN